MNKPAITIISLLGATGFLFAQVEPSPAPVEGANAYEELPELKASEILRENILNGPNHKVREEVIRIPALTIIGLIRTSVSSKPGERDAR